LKSLLCSYILLLWEGQVGSSGGLGVEATSSMMQKFWDTAMAIEPLDNDEDSRRLLYYTVSLNPMSLTNHDIVQFTKLMFHFSEGSLKLASESETGRSAFYPSSGLNTTFGFKIQDRKGRMHRFNCGTDLPVSFSNSFLFSG